jgi:branched-chain amino acid transport system substrate-binding protein
MPRPRSSLGRRHWSAAALAVALALSISACGTETGVSSGATVSVYLSAPMAGAEGKPGRTLCAGAKSALTDAGGKAGGLRVRLTCLDAGDTGGAWTLAAVGANARRAVEDSTTAAYIAEPDPAARRQSRPILEAAGIPSITASSGSSAMARILTAIADADSGSLRSSLSESLSGS